jgi:ATP synthase protein I
MESETNSDGNQLLASQVADKEKRKLEALRGRKGTALYGLGMFGMVGWSVAVPCLLGAALGKWLDYKYPEPFSWTLTCLVAGLFSGCWAGWYWVDKENKKMHENNDE